MLSRVRVGALTSNFGYVSVHGAEPGLPTELARQAAKKRVLNRQHSGEAQNKVLDRGGILCDLKWSPMLNDAFILGGVHGASQFELALPLLEDSDIV